MLIGANLIALGLAIGLPLALLISRGVIRSQRGALYNDLVVVLYPNSGEGQVLPLLELVRNKYAAGPSTPAMGARTVPHATHQPRGLVFNLVLFAALSFMGWTTLLVPKACLLAASQSLCSALPLGFAINDGFFWTSDMGPGRDQTVAIAAVAFLGAYVTASQTLIRRLLNYELGAMAFLRASFQLFMGVVVAVVGYRALSPTIGGVPGVVAETIGQTITSNPTTQTAAAAFWLGAAFLIGLAPQAGLSWVASQLNLRLQKAVNLKALQTAEIIPVEIIDGIDSDIRFRLEDNNILDVQNLATRNPVELYIETPYGLLEVFDWILQAQLCTVVGASTFDLLKKHNIRTIFDLERAVLADDAPTAYVQAIGQVVYSDASEVFRKALATTVDGPMDAKIIRHGVAVICDDLHVHRLRALWQQILARSSTPEGREWLYRTGALPGDAKPPN